MTSPMPQYNIVGTGEPRDTLAKMDGMRVRATSGIGKAFAAVGAVPTSVTATEAYNAMESGVVDTVAFAQHPGQLSFSISGLAPPRPAFAYFPQIKDLTHGRTFAGSGRRQPCQPS